MMISEPEEILACPCGGAIEVPRKGEGVCSKCGMAGAYADVDELSGHRLVLPYIDEFSEWKPPATDLTNGLFVDLGPFDDEKCDDSPQSE